MTDEKLFKVIKYLDDEIISRSCDPWTAFKKGYMSTPSQTDNVRSSRARSNIYLTCLSTEDLNDLVTIVEAGERDRFRKDDPAWKRDRGIHPYNDYIGWRSFLKINRKSADDCIEYLRNKGVSTVIRDIISYLAIEPKTDKQRELLAKANKCRISERQKKLKMEVR